MTESLGQLLMQDETYKDYELIIYDGKLRASVKVHRAVLQTTCRYFAEHSRSMLHFWHIPKGCTIANAHRFLVFLYTRNHADLPHDLQQAAALCLQLGCSDIQQYITQLHVSSSSDDASSDEASSGGASSISSEKVPTYVPISSRTRRKRHRPYPSPGKSLRKSPKSPRRKSPRRS